MFHSTYMSSTNSLFLNIKEGGDHTLVMFGPQSHAGLCVMLCKLPQGGDENLIMYNTGNEVHVECVQDLIRSLHKSIFFQYFSLSLRMFWS